MALKVTGIFRQFVASQFQADQPLAQSIWSVRSRAPACCAIFSAGRASLDGQGEAMVLIAERTSAAIRDRFEAMRVRLDERERRLPPRPSCASSLLPVTCCWSLIPGREFQLIGNVEDVRPASAGPCSRRWRGLGAPQGARPNDLIGWQATTKLEKLAVTNAPPDPRRQWNGWANFVVGVMLSVGPFPRLAR